MYELKQDVGLDFLIDRELIQLRLGLHQVVFIFDEDVSISVEGEFMYFDGQKEWRWRPEPGSHLVAAHAVALLGTKVEHVEKGANNSFEITLANGRRLEIFAPSQEYECYNITRPGQTIIV
jgi:hypothetical protein